MEIEALKGYRQAKSNLELYRLSLPNQFWGPVASFCDVVDESVSREAYSSPNDKTIRETLNRQWHAVMREINDISFGMPPSEPVSPASVS